MFPANAKRMTKQLGCRYISGFGLTETCSLLTIGEIIAVPDEKWGEIPKAIVALKPNAQATEKELVDFCREHLASFKTPKSISFVSELPKTGSGKILKTELRKRVQLNLGNL